MNQEMKDAAALAGKGHEQSAFRAAVVLPLLNVATIYRNAAAQAFAEGNDDSAKMLRSKAQEIETLAENLPFVSVSRPRG